MEAVLISKKTWMKWPSFCFCPMWTNVCFVCSQYWRPSAGENLRLTGSARMMLLRVWWASVSSWQMNLLCSGIFLWLCIRGCFQMLVAWKNQRPLDDRRYEFVEPNVSTDSFFLCVQVANQGIIGSRFLDIGRVLLDAPVLDCYRQ